MNTGFQLRALRVSGKGKEPAELLFGPGCNVIAGASNTGKSYILQCIDFICGSSKRPKTIDESVGYESVELEFETIDGVLHRFERSLKGLDVRHSIKHPDGWQPADPEVIGAKHDADDEDTVSGVLLNASGLWGNKVRRNAAGNLDTLSFRDVSRLVFVDEMRIIADSSPVLTGQYTSATKELAVFRLLLTGVDDGSIIARETRKESLSRKKAQLELLDRMIGRVEEQIARADKEPASVSERKKRVDEAISGRTQIVTASQQEIAQYERRRQEAWTAVQKVAARQNATEQLQSRFRMLERHYNNDLARLNAIIEADHYFSQLREVRCPLCGAAADDHDAAVHEGTADDELVDLRTACKQEVRKIQNLLRDLVGTTEQLETELSDLTQQHAQQLSLFTDATRRLQTELAPKTEQLQGEVAQLMETRHELARVEILMERLAGLQEERNEIASTVWKAQPKQEDEPKETLVPQAIERFTLNVQSLLAEWRYPDLTRVTFSSDTTDLVISGKDRASEGKGFRAIAYSAFVIGLMHYCASEGKAHPFVAVLDSPLVTYKRRDTQPGEAIPEDMKKAFYEALTLTPPDQQIIVLENEDPDEDVQAKIHYTHFSRTHGVGRYGFFPVSVPGQTT
jgi:hypothetical protein